MDNSVRRMPSCRGVEFLKQLSQGYYYIEEEHSLARKRLSPFMWGCVLETVRDEKLPITIVNNDFGFGLAIEIYLAPETPGSEPEFIAKFDRRNIPDILAGSFEEDFTLFKSICNFEDNLKLLDFSGLPRPGTLDEYTY